MARSIHMIIHFLVPGRRDPDHWSGHPGRDIKSRAPGAHVYGIRQPVKGLFLVFQFRKPGRSFLILGGTGFESNPAPIGFRRSHEAADGVKDNPKLGIVFVFKGIELSNQLFI
jgi:hypothetical protein